VLCVRFAGRFLRPPRIIFQTKPFNKFLIVYGVVGFLALVIIVVCIVRYRQRAARVRLHEVCAP
jgi:hypothetical protein